MVTSTSLVTIHDLTQIQKKRENVFPCDEGGEVFICPPTKFMSFSLALG